MAAKLGSADVSFRLGAVTPAAVYLGSEEVWSAVTPRTLYFTGAVDGDWAELGNWFDDAEGTVAASSLPTAADSVIAMASITINTGSVPTVVDFTMPASGSLATAIVVTGHATFSIGALNNSTVTGDATFNDSFNYGTVNGDATFNDGAANYGTVTGDATFNDDSNNYGTVSGAVTCNTTGSCP